MIAKFSLFKLPVFWVLTLACSLALGVFAQPQSAPAADPAPEAPLDPKPDDGEVDILGPWREHRHSNRVLVGTRLIVRTNEVADGVVLIGGSALIEGKARELVVIGGDLEVTGEIEDQVVVVAGNAKISGVIEDRLTLILGRGEFGPKSSIGPDSLLVGGPFDITSGAEIDPDTTEINIAPVVSVFEGLKRWFMGGLLYGRILVPYLGWNWVVVGVTTGIYLLLLGMFRLGVTNTTATLQARPLSSMFAGVLASGLVLPLCVLLISLAIPALAVPFVLLGFVLLILFGKAGLMLFIGDQFIGLAGSSASKRPALALLVGAAIIALLYLIPIIGVLAFLMGTCTGIGAALLALFKAWSRPEAPAPLTTPPPGPIISSPNPGPAPVPVSMVAPQVATTAADFQLLPRAGFWKRLMAALLDLVILGIAARFLHQWVIPVAIIYFVGFWTWRGVTIGMIIMGLKLVRLDGQPLNFAVALVRSLASFFSGIVLFLGFLWTAWDREKQSWHDKIAGTVIVRMPKGTPLI